MALVLNAGDCTYRRSYLGCCSGKRSAISEFPGKTAILSIFDSFFGTSCKVYGEMAQQHRFYFSPIALSTTGNTGAAFYDLLSKDALYYNRELEARYRLIETECAGKQTPCILNPVAHKPATLFFLDISENANDERNLCFGQYFRLN